MRYLFSICMLLVFSGCWNKKGNQSGQSSEGKAAAKLAAQMKSLEENWVPENRITEKKRGPLILFQGHDNKVLVDWAFEVNTNNIDKSVRHIPIDVVILNNSYETIEFEDPSAPLFTFRIRRGYTKIVKEYVSIQKAEPLFPGERINCMINWDGRDVDGKYALPGGYEFLTEVARMKGRSKLKVSRDFHVVEAGPKERAVVNEQQLMQERMEELNRINQSLFGQR